MYGKPRLDGDHPSSIPTQFIMSAKAIRVRHDIVGATLLNGDFDASGFTGGKGLLPDDPIRPLQGERDAAGVGGHDVIEADGLASGRLDGDPFHGFLCGYSRYDRPAGRIESRSQR